MPIFWILPQNLAEQILHVQKEFGIRAVRLGIPGKYAPKESAYILERSMERFCHKVKT